MDKRKCAYCGREIIEGNWEVVTVARTEDEVISYFHYCYDTHFIRHELKLKQETIDSLRKDRSYLSKRVTELEKDNGLTITNLVQQSHETAVDKGWYEEPKTFGELIALCHSELSEALEEFRRGNDVKEIYYEELNSLLAGYKKPEGIPIELADVVIRVADMCGYYGIDLEEAVRIKMEYNKTREHRHGGKVI